MENTIVMSSPDGTSGSRNVRLWRVTLCNYYYCITIALLFITVFITPSSAVQLGGKGAMTRELIKGEMHISGLLSVEGVASFNKIKYFWPVSQEPGTYLRNDGSGKLTWQKEIVPGGSNGALQFNDKGSFAGDDKLLWDNANKTLTVGNLGAGNLAAQQLTVSGLLDAKTITQAGTPVSLSGHPHATTDITSGILGVKNGGTGTDNGSITGIGALTFTAGGNNQNINLVPSGNGYVIVGGKGLNVLGAEGISGTFAQVTDIRLNGNTLQKKVRTITVSGGVITNLGSESDWMDAGSIKLQQ